ncbi:cofilin-2-like isoform X2 [Erpetoichthys calabaricus]|uniref:Cofilin 1 (non-muscle), like n=1 Tax=Erpetoichthys calabaricus TaxID=27687 RepID=A0A8C4T5N2_ERPCA|nr:cofilin-2-like isoform X1 [Erpetoichthys calabaricus]XP_028676834.1 cofilin-2-like isoform X2 [Erpetoichthys calabaricus]
MASGVAVDDEVFRVFEAMKMRKGDVKRRKKMICFCLNDDMTKIIVEKDVEILNEDIGNKIKDPYTESVNMLPNKDCRYVVLDISYHTKEGNREDLVFMLWSPEAAPVKQKMLYASSKDALRKKFTGIRCELQVTSRDDVLDRSFLACKLGGTVLSIEGIGIH